MWWVWLALWGHDKGGSRLVLKPKITTDNDDDDGEEAKMSTDDDDDDEKDDHNRHHDQSCQKTTSVGIQG